KGILAYSEEPLVSSDVRGDEHSAIVDGFLTQALGDHLVKVLAWYDNEWGYACRVADVTSFIAQRL
ncbi:MAG TPA: type I glyceraldehyde-3-phosphate dehydrogenase, partial [Ktedonobacterales bacterium]|nr:type I glyceraldehyde-3-phosphate dehydrogenase [Ktedonobacterales bacterium]